MNLAQMATGVRFFNNTITEADFLCNYMVNCQRGVTIEKCDIGDQGIFPGNPPGPIDDQWVYNGNFQREADVRGFLAPLNKNWYVGDLNLPLGPDPNFILPQFTAVPALADLSIPSNCTNPCGTIFQCKQKKIAAIAQNQVPYNFLSITEQFLTKQSAFDALRNEPQLLQQGTAEDSILQSFSDSILQTNLGKIRKAKEYIANNDFAMALQENAAIIPGNLMEENSKSVNDIYLRTWAVEKLEIDSMDVIILEMISQQNPIDGGEAVYSARAMFGIMLDDFTPMGSARIAKFDKNDDNYIEYIALHDDYFISSLYPNPSDGYIKMDYKLPEDINANLTVFNIVGEVVGIYPIFGAGQLQIDNRKFKSGLYFYKIESGQTILLKDKIVIIK